MENSKKDKKLQLVFGSFNIQGSLSRKSTYKEFTNFINSTDLTVVQESWLTKGEKFKLENFLSFKANRTKSKKAKRGSGGLLIAYKEIHKKVLPDKNPRTKNTSFG